MGDEFSAHGNAMIAFDIVAALSALLFAEHSIGFAVLNIKRSWQALEMRRWS
jgi:hypothetical protein